jgi:scyllo-inositol 2-dehydrogenase (NAD+)
MTARLSCGVIGLGRLGFRHAETLAGRIGNAKLEAVSDPDQERLNLFTSRFPAVLGFSDYREVLNAKNIDAVVIASPTDTHHRITMEAIRAGKRVFCEKPLTLDAEEARGIVRETEKYHAFVQVGFMRRFDPGYTVAKTRLDAGEIGDPVFVRCISRDPAPPPLEFARASGGLIQDLCIHDMDLSRWLLKSEAVRVYARGGVLMCRELEEIGDMDHADILLNFAGGAFCTIEGSRNARYGYDVWTEIVGTRGALFIGELHHTPAVLMTENGSQRDLMPWFLDRFERAYFEEMRNFVDHVLQDKEPAVTARDGLQAILMATAAKKSLETGMPLALNTAIRRDGYGSTNER